MIAAIYARKSTDQPGVEDEAKSVTRQVEHARAYAVRKGWTVAEASVYVDDGISGAEFVKRPGLLRLMNALKPSPPFQTLIMSEESRLGREQIETAYALKQILDAGVRVFFYLEDRERTLDSAMDKVLLSLTTFGAEFEREKARQRTHDALQRKARAGHVTGGKVYGYDNVAVFADTPGPDGVRKRLHVVRRINPEQAAVVRRIFDLSMGGLGLTRIAKTLNAEHVPPPRSGGKGWAPTAIREILHRPLYQGQIVWNQTQKIHRRGTKAQRRRPAEEVLRVDAPDLRIVPEDLWRAAHDRLARTRTAYTGRGCGRLAGSRSRLDGEAPYLLSGMACCAICGGAIVSLSRHHGRRRGFFYGCAYNWKRGPEVCSNQLHLPQVVLDDAVLRAISHALDDHVLEAAVAQALARLRTTHAQQGDRRQAIERELARIDAIEQRLVEAIKRAEAMEPLLAALKQEERRKLGLRDELAGLAQAEQVISLDEKRLERDLKSRVADVRGLLERHVPQTRQVLRRLLVNRLECRPFEAAGVRGYRFVGQASYGGILVGDTWPNSGGGPKGIRALR